MEEKIVEIKMKDDVINGTPFHAIIFQFQSFQSQRKGLMTK